ncbi:MAG: transglycosylase domain-containing protein [Actinomycetota bacterium]|nr:transglycosylase domain-containing protein [Actinomycetota bacterium]
MYKVLKYAGLVLLSALLLGLSLALLIPAVRNVSIIKEKGTFSSPIVMRPLSIPSKIFDSQGNLIYLVQNGQNRTTVTLNQVPQLVKSAVLDVEDHTYYLHGAIDLRSIGRALVADFSGQAGLQGGSTITQQLVKQAVLNSSRTLSRKFSEAIISFRLQGVMTKAQIFQRYLNTIYFGEGAYGIAAAAQTYFGENLNQLDVAQSALLAALIENPSGYDPFYYPTYAMQRRNLAIEQMFQYGTISRAQEIAAKKEPLPTVSHRPTFNSPSAFVTEVVSELETEPQFSFLGSDPTQRYASLTNGGYSIQTTLNPTDQAYADAAVKKIVPNTNGKYTAALVSTDPKTGNVLAMVSGNPNPGSGGFNVATGRGGTGRQPGSSFKIFTLASALESGYSPTDIIDGTGPCTFTVPNTKPFPYVASNAEPGYGLMTLTDATANSVNCAYIRLAIKVGLQNVVDTAHIMGVKSPLLAVPSVAIGSEDVTPLEMATAYGVLASGGYLHPARFITSVIDSTGKYVYNPVVSSQRVLSSRIVAVMDSVLQQVIIRGTGTAAAIGRPAAGKTGTTDNFTDGWFDGYTPQMVTTVWMGDPAGDVPMYDVGGIPVYGGTYPARIWHSYMASALSGQPVEQFPAVSPSWIPPSKFIVPIDSPGAITSPTTTTSTSAPTTSTTAPTTSASPTTAPTTSASPTTTPATTTSGQTTSSTLAPSTIPSSSTSSSSSSSTTAASG